MLSTPPAFNLSQNQTLQLIEKNWLSLTSKFDEAKLKVLFPFALHLSKNQYPAVNRRTSALFSGTRSRCQAFFSSFFKSVPRRSSKRRVAFIFLFDSFVNNFFHSQQNSFFKPPVPFSVTSGEVCLCTFSPPLSTTFYTIFQKVLRRDPNTAFYHGKNF